jgi:hypothetical protein
MQSSALLNRGFPSMSEQNLLPDDETRPAKPGTQTGNSVDDSVAAIFSRPRNDAPWWVLPLLTFFAGVAIPGAALVGVNATPDYQRGVAAGYAIGRADAAMEISREHEDLLKRVVELEKEKFFPTQ